MNWNDLFNIWYMWLSSLNNALSTPVRDLSDGLGIPLVSAFLFGLLGTTAPCQLTTNFGALAFLTRQPVRRAATLRATLAYVAAKLLVYTILGLVVLSLGQRLVNTFVPYMEWMRKFIGPVMILLGLAVLGVLRVRFHIGQGMARRLEREASSMDAQEQVQVPMRLAPSLALAPAAVGGPGAMPASSQAVTATGSARDAAASVATSAALAPSVRSSFLLGLGFSLAFCPTLFLLFFGVTMTLAARSAGGFAFPAAFGFGATVPLLLLVGVTLTGADATKRVRQGMRRVNRPLRWLSGVVLILLGLHDTFIYWFL